MIARLSKWWRTLSDAFWVLPTAMVLFGVLSAIVLTGLDRGGIVAEEFLQQGWLYSGGATGARTLLGAIASSTIGVAGTAFSITIAALTLASAQMGPRLLHNFTRDRGNQFTLGTFLMTFAFALLVLRSIRAQEEGDFVPHLSLAVAILLALACVLTLIYFVGHMANRINVDTVIDLVGEELHAAMQKATGTEAPPQLPDEAYWKDALTITDSRRGYLQELNETNLADWASQQGSAVRLLVRRGDFVFPGVPIALVVSPVPDPERAIRAATALGSQRRSSLDVDYAIRQLVEVAVRALSTGYNDLYTTMNILDRFGACLCELNGRHLDSGVAVRGNRPVLVVPRIDYQTLLNSMFDMIRQSARGKTAIITHLLHILAKVASCECNPVRLVALRRYANIVLEDVTRERFSEADLVDICERHRALLTALNGKRACDAVA